jgi:SHS2 domain-containing protein
MPGVYRWVDHTSELEVEIDAPTAEAVFREAAAALAELLGAGSPEGERTIVVEAGDRAALLAAFMEELVFLAESESLVPAAVGEVDLRDTRVRTEVRLARGDPPPLVKAVTYHRLAFEPHGEGFRARAVLDV